MTDGLFHIDGDNRLRSMVAAPYDAEHVLQGLIEQHPDLLAGGQMTPSEPRRWLLVKREQAVPDKEGGGARWSVDHLFVDQDAVPTLVEVKRSSDTRIRREVVGQMLDYAANGVRYWPTSELVGAYEATQIRIGREPGEEVLRLTEDPDMLIESFFARVSDNLRAGRIRMVFVADVIPRELRAIVEFLNEQLDPAEVLAVEVKQYRATGYSGLVIVPSVFGRTAAVAQKDRTTRSSASRAELLERSLPATRECIRRMEAFAQDHGLVTRETRAGLVVQTPGGKSVAVVYLADWDSVEIPLGPLRNRGFREEVDQLQALLQSLTAKRLTTTAPNVPTSDVVAGWDEFVPAILAAARLYANS